jgi:adenosylcobinamide amidohydrolase
MSLLEPELSWRSEDGETVPALVWRAGAGWRMLASSVVGGGLGERAWILNAQVGDGYARLDPERHLAELARASSLDGAGAGMLTAADVAAFQHTEDAGVEVLATVGLGFPTWAAAPPEPAELTDATPAPGTINLVVAVPATLSDAALVNAVATVTEAKVQGLLEAGWACTGTASDAVCVATRVGGPAEAFGGPRSRWGARIARAIHAAVLAGAR